MEVLAAEFRMIDSVQLPIIVSYDDEANAALKALEFADGSVGLSRRLQPYLVQLPRNGFDALYKAGAIAPVNPKKWESNSCNWSITVCMTRAMESISTNRR